MKEEIGYDPNGLVIYMARKQQVGDVLLACRSDEERIELSRRFTQESTEVIRAKTGIEIGSKVRVCLSNGISLVGGMKPAHDHDDPEQHQVGVVTEIDFWGNIHYQVGDAEPTSTHMGMITLCED